MHTVAVMNQKGGVGKTTTACNLSAALARTGKRVLAIDLDPQAHLTLHFSAPPASDSTATSKDAASSAEAAPTEGGTHSALDPDRGTGPTIYDVFVDRAPIDRVLAPTSTPGVSILPANLDLSSAELELAGEIGRETILRSAMQEAKLDERFDVVIIDCPPSLGLLSLNGLTSVSEVLIPLQAEFFALHGIARLLDTIELIHRRLRRGPELLGIVLCRYQRTTRLSREVLDELRQHFGERLLDTVIRQNVRLAEASSHGVPIFQYDPTSSGAEDYAALATEVLGCWERSASSSTSGTDPSADGPAERSAGA